MSSTGVLNVEKFGPVEGGVVHLPQLRMIRLHEIVLRVRTILTVCVSLILALVLSSHVGEVRLATSCETCTC